MSTAEAKITQDKLLAVFETGFGEKLFAQMGFANFSKGLDKIAKSIFPKLIGGMFKMIPVMALLEPLSGFMEGLMIFMEPLAPVLEAIGTTLGTSLLPLTLWLANDLMTLLPYIQDLAYWIGQVVTGLTKFFDALSNPGPYGLFNITQTATGDPIVALAQALAQALYDAGVRGNQWQGMDGFSVGGG